MCVRARVSDSAAPGDVTDVVAVPRSPWQTPFLSHCADVGRGRERPSANVHVCFGKDEFGALRPGAGFIQVTLEMVAMFAQVLRTDGR